MSTNNNDLTNAKRNKNDEFHTQLIDIENEMKHYRKHFKGKTILCNCDDPRMSNFFHYFSFNFERLGLKKLIATCYKNQNVDLFTKGESEKAIWLEYNGDINGNRVPDAHEIGIHYFEGDGDFRSDECIKLLKEADIVITNPPFSLFREYIGQLIEYKKKFIIVGSQNAISYKETFQLIRDNKMWLGVDNGGNKWFEVPDDYEIKTESHKRIEEGKKFFKLRNIAWFTNLSHKKRQEELIVFKKYSKKEYPTFDNYKAINVDKVSDIPANYKGAMGVPITFMDKYNPDQFEILSSNDFRKTVNIPFKAHGLIKDKDGAINGKPKYVRILIRNKKVAA